MIPSDENNNPKNKRTNLILLVIILLFIACNGYYFLVKKANDQKKQKQELVELQNKVDNLKLEKKTLDESYDEIKSKYDALLLENDSMATTIQLQIEALDQSKRKIDQLYARLNQINSDQIQNTINEEETSNVDDKETDLSLDQISEAEDKVANEDSEDTSSSNS